MSNQSDGDDPLRNHLKKAVLAVRQQAVTNLVTELMVILTQHGFTLDQLIDAVADYADQRPQFKGAVKPLEDASMSLQLNQTTLD